MGLDMFLEKRTYIGNNYKELKDVVDLNISEEPHIKWNRVSEIRERVGYWRKANEIHKWFIDNCANGEENRMEMSVTKEELKELLDTCKEVLNGSKLIKGTISNGYTFDANGVKQITEDGMVIEDNSVARKLLPTTSGFFFGSTDYDQYYIEDIKHTVDIIEKCLAEDTTSNVDYEYSASW